MRNRFLLAFTIGLISIGSVAQDNAPKPTVSNEPLTAEQVTIYRAVMKDYLQDASTAINLADLTEPFAGLFSNDSCVKGIAVDKPKSSVPVVHKLNSSVVVDPKISLVDPEKQMAIISKNDPQNLVRAAVDDGKAVTDANLNTSIEQAFANGMLSLSEIVFDSTHHHAVVSYSFVCGSLCGHGETVHLLSVGIEWKVKRKCGDWVS